jgi:hypothetical protein
MTNDETEEFRKARQSELNASAAARAELEERYGKENVFSGEEMRERFTPLGFAAPYMMAKETKTGKKGSLEFQHSPRFYFNWQED